MRNPLLVPDLRELIQAGETGVLRDFFSDHHPAHVAEMIEDLEPAEGDTILALLPAMRARKSGHIINISSIGVQTNPPRFSAYVASKAALDAFSRVIASEVIDDKVHITTINMPLVRTPMIAPTRMYDMFPAITPEEAAEMIAKAMVRRPKKVATKLGNFGELLYAVAPKASDTILNTAYKLFPDSQAAKGKGEERPDKAPSTEAVAFAHLMKGVHW